MLLARDDASFVLVGRSSLPISSHERPLSFQLFSLWMCMAMNANAQSTVDDNEKTTESLFTCTTSENRSLIMDSSNAKLSNSAL
jgi:hypothetical protein